MYKSVVIPENKEYGTKEYLEPSSGKKKVIFNNSSVEHITITAIDPVAGVCVEVIIQKVDLPEFVTNRGKEK